MRLIESLNQDFVSMLDPDCLVWDKVLSTRHVTDVYLLALAVQQGGCFVTLDRRVTVDAVTGALPEHLVMLS